MRLDAVLLLLLVIPVAAEDTSSQPRAQIDHLIAAQVQAKKPASLALLRDAITLSLSIGVPAFNAGDHEGCMTCYRDTIASLMAAFPGLDATTPAASIPFRDLADAAKRAHAFIDLDRQAWTLRFGFDQVYLACSQMASQGQLQVRTGAQYFSRGDYDEAEIAFSRGMADAQELHGSTLTDTPASVRIASILHAQTLVMLGRLPQAAAEMAPGMIAVPELVSEKFDLHPLYGDQVRADTALEVATTYASAHATDADALFLEAFEQQFCGKVDEAAKTLALVLKLAPTHAGALFLTTADPKTVPGSKGGSDTLP